MVSKHFQNKARRAYWSVHVEAWQRSGLSRRRYCRVNGLADHTFKRWVAVLVDAKALQIQRELDAEVRRKRRERRRKGPSHNKRSQAVQAFWAMHIEAMIWSGLSIREYAAGLHLSPYSLRKWRDRIEDGEADPDWRALLHPSARPKLSTGVSSAAKEPDVESGLTDASAAPSASDEHVGRRRFTDEEKRAIVEESELPGSTAAEVCRRHGIVTSMLFRWRVQLGYRKEKVKLATFRASAASSADALVLHDLLPAPDGMAALNYLADRVFAPAGADPEAVRRYVV
ncbi:MAG: transposase, partial [Alphaproteobacteria bacterium]|nr:transposase [Alphaproteobacteria bacterium]